MKSSKHLQRSLETKRFSSKQSDSYPTSAPQREKRPQRQTRQRTTRQLNANAPLFEKRPAIPPAITRERNKPPKQPGNKTRMTKGNI